MSGPDRNEQSYMAMLEEIEPDDPIDEGKVWYIHKHEVQLASGGPEEGGWWYTQGIPAEDWNPSEHEFHSKNTAIARCWELNADENERRHAEEDYEYHSVLAYRSTFYQYDIAEDPTPYWFPSERPHYE